MSDGSPPLPLRGLRILEYSQYVAGPFAALLLADLGADVIKVEPPAGDAWRRYAPFRNGQSRHFYALNRNKRSVVLDLADPDGRRASEALIASADAVLHNMPPARAERFGLDRENVRRLNPQAVWCCVSALGSEGPESSLSAFDLVAQALSGLLAVTAQPDDPVPQRAGGIAMADVSAGLLAAIAVLAGLLGRRSGGAPGIEGAAAGMDASGLPGAAPGIEVSLLGAALAVQAQRFVSVEELDLPPRRRAEGPPATASISELTRQAAARAAADELEPYYRAYAAADGFFVLACLQQSQRAAAAGVLGLEDPWLANPQAPPADPPERERRRELVREFERRLKAQPVHVWVSRFRAAGVPAAELRLLEQLFEHEQAKVNGLVQTLHQPGVGEVKLLGSLFKVEGTAHPARRGIPGLGEHTEEVLAECLAAQP